MMGYNYQIEGYYRGVTTNLLVIPHNTEALILSQMVPYKVMDIYIYLSYYAQE